MITIPNKLLHNVQQLNNEIGKLLKIFNDLLAYLIKLSLVHFTTRKE